MANPSKVRGTAYENEILVELRKVFGPDVDRAKAGNASNDFHGVPFPVEVKHRKSWAVRDWIRKVRIVSTDGRWMICAADGDRRLVDSVGDVVILPRALAFRMLSDYWQPQARPWSERTGL